MGKDYLMKYPTMGVEKKLCNDFSSGVTVKLAIRYNKNY